MFENKELTGVFGPKTGEELHNLYSSPSIITVIRSRGCDG
jgi:hypothetical protein